MRYEFEEEQKGYAGVLEEEREGRKVMIKLQFQKENTKNDGLINTLPDIKINIQ